MSKARFKNKESEKEVEWRGISVTDERMALREVSLILVSGTGYEPLWNKLVKKHHYLGYANLLGHRLKYLAIIGENPVAALSWSAPALKLRVRDWFIGWSVEQRKKYLCRLASNSRFLIMPWVKIYCLASYVLSLNMRCVSVDWKRMFGHELWMLETFVDPRYFRGTSYRAANWKFLGHTSGSRKEGKGYVYHGNKKEVYVYVLNEDFRKEIGCRQKSALDFRCVPPTKEVEELKMILRHADWHPDLVPVMDLTEDDLKSIAEELVGFHKEFHRYFGRIEHQQLGLSYISGLLSNCQAKSAEPIALEFLGEGKVRSLQRFMKTYKWDHEGMEKKHLSLISELISSPSGMISVDSTEFVKKGKESVGVARQYCGRMGKVENCQSGVFVGYSSQKGYGLLTSRLYMPESWFLPEQEERRKKNLIPEDLSFKTKPQIASELIKKIVDSGLFPARWIGCDSTFGSDWEFLNSLPEGKSYFASIKSDTRVFLERPEVGIAPYQGRGAKPRKISILPGEPAAVKVRDIIKSHDFEWKRVILAEGAKGPIVADIGRLRVYPCLNGLPGDEALWLFVRRTSDGQVKYAFSNAPYDIHPRALCSASIMRWPIEQCFQDGKSHVGMDYYEHRSWPAWHRHMIYICLALHFLLRLRLRFKKKLHP